MFSYRLAGKSVLDASLHTIESWFPQTGMFLLATGLIEQPFEAIAGYCELDSPGCC